MDSVNKYLIYGPASTLKRMPEQLFEGLEPKYLYKYSSSKHDDLIFVSVYEEYEKQINASVTLTCVIAFTGKKIRFELKKTGGRMGFRGSSLDEEKRTVDDEVVDFIIDFSKRYGLTVQQEKEETPKDEA